MLIFRTVCEANPSVGVANIVAHQPKPDVLYSLPTLAVVDRKAHTKFLSRIVFFLIEHDLRDALGAFNAEEAANFAAEINCSRDRRLMNLRCDDHDVRLAGEG